MTYEIGAVRTYLLALRETGQPSADVVAGFVAHARWVSEQRGFTRRAFLEVGVPARVLDAAGIDERVSPNEATGI